MEDQENQKSGYTAEDTISRLESQIESDPMGTLWAGLTFGAGIATLGVHHFQMGALWLSKLILSEAIQSVKNRPPGAPPLH